MSIQNPQAYLDSIWDWKPLHPCFQRGIEPTDIDGFVEVGGYFLIFEGKAPGVPLKDGQRKAFERMARRNQIIPGLFTIIVLWGNAKASRIDQLQFWPAAPFASGWAELQTYVSAWSEWAEERAAIEDEPSMVDSLIEIRPRPIPPPAPAQPLKVLTADDIFGRTQ